MAGPNRSGGRPGRLLAAFAGILVVMLAALTGGVLTDDASWSPKLGLDLEGGTQIVLEPVLTNGGQVTDEQLTQAVDIIRARVDGSGVAEAEITTQGNRNIVVALPGTPTEEQRNLIKQSAQLRFRAVIVAAPAVLPPAPTPSGTATPTGTATPSGGAAPTATPTVPAASAPASSAPAQRAVPAALAQQAVSPTTAATPAPSGAPGAPAPTPTATVPAQPTPGGTPKDGSDPAWVTAAVQQQFEALDCSDTTKLQGGTDDPAKPFVTCSSDGTEKYILGPAEVLGQDIKDSTAGLQQTQQGAITNTWEVQLSFNGKGTREFAEVTSRLVNLPDPRNRFGIVLDGLVISAPSANEPITGGTASITGSFNQASATELANQLKYGALPLSFTTQTEEQISPLLGKEQLQRGLLAGGVGLALVIVYSLFQYRALGLVTVASLLVAGGMTYLAIALLGWTQNFRLTLAGVTGLIVSIGVTADSFIVYFERVRDEVRDGRSLRVAVEQGWRRARRTILVADGVSFLAALVLYVLAAGNVRGFAYALGLTTLIDVIVVIMFTHPLVAYLARTKFFGDGHRWSGLDPERLGVLARPGGLAAAGRAGRTTIAGRRAAARQQAGQSPAEEGSL